MQCKDIPTIPILEFLERRAPLWSMLWRGTDGYSSNNICDNCVSQAFPPGISYKLAHAKMVQLYYKDLVTGCPCGCRGDWELTDKGRKKLQDHRAILFNKL